MQAEKWKTFLQKSNCISVFNNYEAANEVQYLISKLAAEDIEQSFWWYEERSKQAADNFTIEVEDAIGKICTNPTIGKNKYEDSYELRLKKFPFTVIYLIVEKEKMIIVTGVYHMMRDPKKKYRKR